LIDDVFDLSVVAVVIFFTLYFFNLTHHAIEESEDLKPTKHLLWWPRHDGFSGFRDRPIHFPPSHHKQFTPIRSKSASQNLQKIKMFPCKSSEKGTKKDLVECFNPSEKYQSNGNLPQIGVKIKNI